ncbi:MAG: hypothetical protein LBK06_05085 [Planctomycetaceae bacterium]|nr:hypothetical protein [Planctomycetaceae bacterium]
MITVYAEAVLKFGKLNTQAQQRGAVVHRRSLPPYRLRYNLIVKCSNMYNHTKRINP